MKFQKIYSKAQRSRTPVPPQRELSDSEEDDGSFEHPAEYRSSASSIICIIKDATFLM